MYDEPSQERLVRSVVDKIHSAWPEMSRHMEGVSPKNPTDEEVEELAKAMHEFDQTHTRALHLASAVCKNDAFSEEREWRVLILVGLNRLKAEIKFRQGVFGLIPYLPLDLT